MLHAASSHVIACRCCSTGHLEPVLDLGHHPLADRFLSVEDLERPEVTYPLRVGLCASCGYAGLLQLVPAAARYQAADYSYTAGNSPVSCKHFDDLAAVIVNAERLGANDFVVDAGGNDGTFLRAVADRAGCRVLNVEPSANMAKLSRSAGVEVAETFFEDAQIDDGSAAVIVTTNVFNHSSDPHAFVARAARALRDDGVFVIEVPHVGELLQKAAFDTIYLEHVSFFSASVLRTLLAAHGLVLVQAEISPYMGGSIRCIARKRPLARMDPGVVVILNSELAAGCHAAATWDGLQGAIIRFRADLLASLWDIRRRGGSIAAIGAAAKGNTLLNYVGVDRGLVTCVTDASPHKIGKFTPGTHLPIVADADLPAETTHALILPWNIATHLRARYAHLPVEFIVPDVRKFLP